MKARHTPSLFLLALLLAVGSITAQTTEYLFTKKTSSGGSVTFAADLLSVATGNLHIDSLGNIEVRSDNDLGTALGVNLKLDASSSLNASNLASGTVPTARLGSGTANNTTYLRGDGTWQTVSAGVSLSAANQWTAQQSFNTASTTGAININPTWNSAGTVFAGIYMRATDTASNSGSGLIDLGYGSTSVFKVTRAGNAMLNLPTSAGPRMDLYGFAGGGFSVGYGTSMGITGGGGTTTALRLDNGGNPLYITSGNTATIAVNPTTTSLSFGSALASMDVVIARASAARLSIAGSSGGAAVQLTEMTAPTGPSANTVLLYSDDNGSGKTRLMALFPSGAAQVLAIEP